ncbi:MAG: T9SS type A sorting domain-containing protein [Bacteroidetes bacterium]|nr:T9SS type A sorting domain-containing protein [Bacteroidota bacterium]
MIKSTRKFLSFFLVVFFFSGIARLSAQSPAVAISSYFNTTDPRDEWSELLVISDNVDMRNWTFRDNNSAQTAFQTPITFNNIALWNNLRSGTVIMIWHRAVGSTGTSHSIDVSKQDGYIEVSANDPAYFTGGDFGTAPLYAGTTLNIAGAGDILEIMNGSGTFIHALGHRAATGSSWGPLPTPKLNFQGNLADGDAVFVCPGSSTDEYGTLPPQDGTTWASSGNVTAVTFGLPNTCTSSSTANSDFWRGIRQPGWSSPSLTGTINAGNTQVTLNWNAATDPFPSDGTQGYMILRNTTNTFGTPADGHTYTTGNGIGGATVTALISSSQTVTWIDNITVPCGTTLYYQVYTYRYTTDEGHGNDYSLARGRSYNETSFGATSVSRLLPVAPVSATSDRDYFCESDPGSITLSATGGSGTTLNWFTVNCGGTLLGPGSGTNNSITISSPAVTTTYYARWENECGVSTCADVTVTVLPDLPVSVSIVASQNPVCAGIPVTFTATPVNPGTAPVYQWKVNGADAGTNSPVFTYAPANGDIVSVVLSSSESCTTGNPAASNPVSMNVTATPPAPVITLNGYLLTSSAPAGNQWYLDGTPIAGATGQTWTATVPGEYWVVVTLNGCPSAESNHITILQVGISDITNGTFDVYPVPNDGRFTATITSGARGIFNIKVYNTLGNIICESNGIEVTGTASRLIDLRPVPAGVYTVIFETEGKRVVRKVLVR